MCRPELTSWPSPSSSGLPVCQWQPQPSVAPAKTPEYPLWPVLSASSPPANTRGSTLKGPNPTPVPTWLQCYHQSPCSHLQPLVCSPHGGPRDPADSPASPQPPLPRALPAPKSIQPTSPFVQRPVWSSLPAFYGSPAHDLGEGRRKHSCLPAVQMRKQRLRGETSARPEPAASPLTSQ